MLILFLIKSPILWACGLYLMHYLRSISYNYIYNIFITTFISPSGFTVHDNLLLESFRGKQLPPPKSRSSRKTHRLRCFWLFPLHRGMVSLWHNKNMCRVLRANRSTTSRKQLWNTIFFGKKRQRKTSSCISHMKRLVGSI